METEKLVQCVACNVGGGWYSTKGNRVTPLSSGPTVVNYSFNESHSFYVKIALKSLVFLSCFSDQIFASHVVCNLPVTLHLHFTIFFLFFFSVLFIIACLLIHQCFCFRDCKTRMVKRAQFSFYSPLSW